MSESLHRKSTGPNPRASNQTPITVHAHTREIYTEEEALTIMAQWTEHIGGDFHFDRYKEPGDVEYATGFNFNPDSLKKLIPKWKNFNSFLIPIWLKNGCTVTASVSMEASSFALDFTESKFSSFYEERGFAGLGDCLDWIAEKVNASYGHADSSSIQNYVGYHFYTERSQGLIHRVARWDALDRIEWVNYFRNDIIDEYGRSLLTRGNWHVAHPTTKGMIFVVYDHPPDYEKGPDSDRMDKILSDIDYYRRWEEQAIRVDSAKRDSIEIREGVDLAELKRKWNAATQARKEREQRQRQTLKKLRVKLEPFAALNITDPYYKTRTSNLARVATETFHEATGVTLDYIPESLAFIDKIIDAFRAKKWKSEDHALALICLGCYVGEVIIRTTDATWTNPQKTPVAGLTNSPCIVRFSEDNFCDPIAKVFKRLEFDPSESIEYFYDVFCKNKARRK